MALELLLRHSGQMSDANMEASERPPPARRRVRFFFELEPGDYRQVFWVELDNEAGDFYWGPPGDVPAVQAQPFTGTTATITVPDDLDSLAREHRKNSHHASGVMHTTGDLTTERDRWWGTLDGLSHPRRFCVIISKHPTDLPPYKRSLTRGRSAAIVLRIPAEKRDSRQYLELFLSPAGEFAPPPPALRFGQPIVDQPIVQSLSQERDLLLIVRHLTLGGPFSTWRPDVQLWLTMNPDEAIEL